MIGLSIPRIKRYNYLGLPHIAKAYHIYRLFSQHKYLETNENESTIIQNLRDTAGGVPKGKFIAIQSYLRKQEQSQINNLTLHLELLEKEEQMILKVNRRKVIKNQSRNK